MAPFSGKTVVLFEDVPVTKTAKRFLKIINPSEEPIKVTVTKSISLEHNFSLNWIENCVPAKSEISMEMVWSPQMTIACNETIQIVDNRNFRKNIRVILKSKPAGQTKNVRKLITKSFGNNTHVKTLTLKSPTNAVNKVVTRLTQQHIQQHQIQRQTTVQKKLLKPCDAAATSGAVYKNNSHLNRSIKVTSVTNKTLLMNNTKTTDVILRNLKSPLMERNIHPRYKEGVSGATNLSLPIVERESDDSSKENISPLTATNVFNKIDELQFTPNTITHSKPNQSKLVLLATPTGFSTANTTALDAPVDYVRELKPRCLSNELVDEVICNPDIHNETKGSTIITNRTFDVKLNESFEISHTSFSNEGSDSNTCGLSNNKTIALYTTPKTSSLHIIQEEDNSSIDLKSTSKVENHNKIETPKQNENYLKRDIKVIGTPLRKHFVSMRNLYQKSPQSILTQGSLPNLHEIESIKYFEQNRFFKPNTSQVDVKPSSRSFSGGNKNSEHKSKMHSESADKFSYSQISLISHPDLQFNQNEILAQSSRFNLNEVGLKYFRNSPNILKYKKNNYIKPNFSLLKTSKNLKTVTETHKPVSNKLSFSQFTSMDSVISGSSGASFRTGFTKSSYVTISPPKRQRLEMVSKMQQKKTSNKASYQVNIKNWSQTEPQKYKLSKTLSLIKKPLTPCKGKDQPRVKLYEADLYLQPYISPDPFAATTTCDPFLSSNMYLDEASVDKLQTDLKKWLNALVTIPAELNADSNTKIDVGKLFNEVRHRELVLAPTKEEQSINYLTNFRLESLRRAAVELFLSEDLRTPCSKVAVYIKKNALCIRTDRNLHLDVVTQREILELLLCFNPLWLRLGLEVVYGEKINLQSNRDIFGLSSFILNRLFSDKFLEQKYSKAYTLCDEYADHIKKFTLQKFLFLLLFLDKAKEKHIIAHNPCLFIKKSPYKETREILLRFSSALLANVGDITRELKRLGYILTHKQSFLDEFDYAFHNLAVDLRDGIRLTRVMEIILLRDDLNQQLRVPAISRLQKVFNVNLAFKALNEANFQLKGDIVANDIVDGHKEKTLSLLWQIIYKFRSPKFHAAARVIQKWWRHSWLKVIVQRKIRYKDEQRRESAAIKIQALCRGFVVRQYAIIYKKERTRAAIVFQKNIRRYLICSRFLKTVQSILLIQKCWRGRQCRKNFLQLRKSAICLQQYWRNRKQAIFLRKQGALNKCKYIQQRNDAASSIQALWRGYKVRRELSKTIFAVLVCQRVFRTRQLMKAQNAKYLQLKNATVFIQTIFRAKFAMKKQRKVYQIIRSHIIFIQRLYRATILMRKQHKKYLDIRKKVVWMQRKWRATFLARRLRKIYLAMQHYTLIVQQKFRAKRQMRIERKSYLHFKTCVSDIQQRYRTKLEMRSAYCKFQRKLQAIKTIQSHFRAYKAMSYERAKYKRIRKAVLFLQQQLIAALRMKKERKKFLQQKKAAMVIQSAYRAHRIMKLQKGEFLRIKQAVVCIQNFVRRTLVMRFQRKQYIGIRKLIISLQIRYKAILLTKKIRREYLYLRTLIITIQRRFRAKKLMLKEQKYFQLVKNVVIFQAHGRGLLARRRFQALLKPENFEQLRQKKAANIIQRFWRGYCIRKCLNNVRIKAIRNNIALLKVTSNTVNSIKFKIQDAVRLLRGKFSASEALNVLVRLDRISRTVPHLLMCRSSFISTFCYGIMAQAIRSEVDKQLIMYCSRIILNLARYNSTTANTFQKGGLVTIAQMLLRWCDKDCEIFNTLCTLIWVFAHCPVKCKVMHDFMTTTDSIYMVRETKKLLDRKEKMKQNVRKPVATFLSSSSVRCFSQQQQQYFSSHALPSLEPDYGVTRNKPYIFISSVYAFNTILCKLDIDIL